MAERREFIHLEEARPNTAGQSEIAVGRKLGPSVAAGRRLRSTHRWTAPPPQRNNQREQGDTMSTDRTRVGPDGRWRDGTCADRTQTPLIRFRKAAAALAAGVL